MMAVAQVPLAAVIVTYRFAATQLATLLQALAPQVDAIYLIDNNAADEPVTCPSISHLTIIVNGHNIGLAAALNQGIDAALASDAKQILLLDQDSQPSGTMIDALQQSLYQLQQQQRNPAAVGPALLDRRRNALLPFIQYGLLGIKPIAIGNDTVPIRCDMLLTSGSLIDAAALRAIGAMDASLFVYAIDTDWCFRARAAGFSLYGIPQARLIHTLGQATLQLPFAAVTIAVHSPRRQYYIVRNYIWLMRRHYVPLSWKLGYLPRLIGRWIIFSTLVAPRWKNFLSISKGLWHGLVSRH